MFSVRSPEVLLRNLLIWASSFSKADQSQGLPVSEDCRGQRMTSTYRHLGSK